MPLDPNIPLQVRAPDLAPALAQLGTTLGNLPAQRQELELRQQQIRSNQAIEEKNRFDTAARTKAADDHDRINAALAANLKPNAAGVLTYDRQALQAAAHKDPSLDWTTIAAHLDKSDESTAKFQAAQAAAAKARAVSIGTAALAIRASGNTPTAFQAGLVQSVANKEMTEAEAAPYFAQLKAAPTMETVKGITDGLIAQAFPKETLEDQLKAPDRAETAAMHRATEAQAAATAAATAADRAGDNTRADAAAKELGRHNLATEATARAAQGTAAGRLALERGNSPLTNATGQTGLSPVPPGTRDDALLQTLPTATAEKVKALLEGRLQLPPRIGKGDTYWQGVLDLAVRVDPAFDAVNYNARSKTRQDFTSGKSAQTVNALNTVAQHLDRLSTRVDALNNTWSPGYNSVANFVSQHTGSSVVTKFETDKKAVVDELTRAWRQAGGTESDIKSWSAVLDAAGSPEQLHGAIGEMGELVEGKLSATTTQYQQGMGTDRVSTITPAARAVFDRIKAKAGGTAPAAKAAPAAAAAITVTDPHGGTHPFTTQAEADAFKKLAGIR